MKNFLKIRYQEEMIQNYNRSIVFRGGRGGGKSVVAMKWAVENMKHGKSVVFVSGIDAITDNTKRMLIRHIEREGLIVMNQFEHLIMTDKAGIIVVDHRHRLLFEQGYNIHDQAIVIDDADFLELEKFKNLRYSEDTNFFITGTDDEKTMGMFLTPDIFKTQHLYREANYLDMIEAGLMTERSAEEWKKVIGETNFRSWFGPWAIHHNKDAKHLLKNVYD